MVRQIFDGRSGVRIVSFDQELDVQFFGRVVERRQGSQQLRYNPRLPIERDQQCVDRQVCRIERYSRCGLRNGHKAGQQVDRVAD
jgi:hypothetical protein